MYFLSFLPGGAVIYFWQDKPESIMGWVLLFAIPPLTVVLVALLIEIPMQRRARRDERLRAEAYRARKIALEQHRLAVTPLRTLTPKDFEHEIARVFREKYGHPVEVVGGANDGGVDLRVTHRTTGELIGIVQAKNYDPVRPLPLEFIRSLHSVKIVQKVPRAVLVTTTYCSPTAYKLAESLGVHIIDGADFEKMRGTVSQPALPEEGIQA